MLQNLFWVWVSSSDVLNWQHLTRFVFEKFSHSERLDSPSQWKDTSNWLHGLLKPKAAPIKQPSTAICVWMEIILELNGSAGRPSSKWDARCVSRRLQDWSSGPPAFILDELTGGGRDIRLSPLPPTDSFWKTQHHANLSYWSKWFKLPLFWKLLFFKPFCWVTTTRKTPVVSPSGALKVIIGYSAAFSHSTAVWR